MGPNEPAKLQEVKTNKCQQKKDLLKLTVQEIGHSIDHRMHHRESVYLRHPA